MQPTFFLQQQIAQRQQRLRETIPPRTRTVRRRVRRRAGPPR